MLANAPSASARLRTALAGLDARALATMADIAGVERKIARRVFNGYLVGVTSYLRLCSVAGIDPVTGGTRTTRPLSPDSTFLWWFLGAGLYLTRQIKGMGAREAGRETGISYAAISRVERGQPLGIENVLRIAQFIGVHPDGFTGNKECNTLNWVGK